MNKYIFNSLLLMLYFASNNFIFANKISITKTNSIIVGRGEVLWQKESVAIKDNFIALIRQNPERFELTFDAICPSADDQVQIWAGFGFINRDNRYCLGLRGGNNNDLYLCRYQSNAKNKMIALEPLDFYPTPNEQYKIKIVFWKGNIRVYLNDESNPRIVTFDKDYIKGGSTILGGGWIKTVFSNLQINELSNQDIDYYRRDTLKYAQRLLVKNKESTRKIQREAYLHTKIKTIKEPRTEILLNGNWLFMPEQNLSKSNLPYMITLNDSQWHIINVPGFWNPVRNWLYLQDSGFPTKGSGISDNYREKEEARCQKYTFDFKQTSAAWYRHWFELPVNIKGKNIRLHFDAVSKLADVYINENYVGGHVGMFGNFDLDITDYIKPGSNILAVNVKVRQREKKLNADQKVAQAVSVDITNDMLNSLPSGMFGGDEGGIWQDVKLVITEHAYIEDVFANINADGGAIEVKVKNNSDVLDSVSLMIEISDKMDKQLFLRLSSKDNLILKARSINKSILETGIVKPKLWSPENPNLYLLKTKLYHHGNLIDSTSTKIGFRSFEVIGNQFYLNGNPYWMRGANQPPSGIAPNDKLLANKFFKLMHNGNQMITRSHGCPFTQVWMEAADEQGVGVSFEGTWPWLMINNIPSEDLIAVWKEEMLSLVKKYRNHPSLLIWTINNEMYFTMFYHNDTPEVRLKKWKIISEVIKEIRKLSPKTAISSDSGYGRLLADYNRILKPNNIDDGDIDDRHVYFNWYNRDFFQIYGGEWAKRIYWSPGANKNRPFFSQETSTGYTNNDDGHYNRKYLFNNYVPQAWVGDWAYEEKDPKFSLARHAFMSKELYEAIRRTSPETAGVLLFANVTWFRNVFNDETIEPYPIYNYFKIAAQPVLVSAELFGRNFYAGETISPRICIVNNAIDGKSIPKSIVEWKIVSNKNTLTSGQIKIDSISHYDRLWSNIKIKLPKHLPNPKLNCKLILELRTGNITLSSNQYDILISGKNWTTSNYREDKNISVYDITGETCKILDFLGIKYNQLSDLTEIRFINSDLLIISNLDKEEEIPYNWEDVKNVCGNGMNVLLIHPGKHLQWLFYDQIASVYERKGRVVNMHIPEHPAFNGIEPMELSWWQQEGKEKPRVCRRSYRLKDSGTFSSLATYLRPHTGLGSDRQLYLQEMSGIPLIEIKEKKGKLIASEMELNMANKDPIAAKMLVNLINYLKSQNNSF